jgi:histidinol-phosphate aminotransferase
MMYKINSSIQSVKRTFVQERPLTHKNNLMDRNERVDNFSEYLIKNCLKNIKSEDFKNYPNNFKIYDLLSKFNKVNKNNILITDGAEGGLKNFIHLFSNPGEKIVYLSPSYAMYEVYSKLFKLKKCPLNLKLNNNPNFYSNLLNHLKNVKPKLLILANPNQPIETLLNNKEIFSLLRFAKRLKIMVAIDEAYYFFSKVTAIKMIKYFDNLLIVRSFSKAFGLAGLRIGYCISNKNIINIMRSTKSAYEINSINIKILSFFLNSKYVMVKNINEIAKSRIFLINKLKKINILVYGRNSNSVLFQFFNSFLTIKLVRYLNKYNFHLKLIKINKKEFYLRCTLGSLKIVKKLFNRIEIFHRKYAKKN